MRFARVLLGIPIQSQMPKGAAANPPATPATIIQNATTAHIELSVTR
jgi:hypothetical protein